MSKMDSKWLKTDTYSLEDDGTGKLRVKVKATGAIDRTDQGLDLKAGGVGTDHLSSGLDIAKFGAGTVTNTELGYLAGVEGPIQEQIDNLGGDPTAIAKKWALIFG